MAVLICFPYVFANRKRYANGLNYDPSPRFTGTIRKSFCFIGRFTKIFLIKGLKQGVLKSGYSYQLVVIKSHSYLHVVVLLLYTPAYSRGCDLVCFFFFSLQPGA